MPSPKRTVSGFNRFAGLAQGILRWAGARRAGNAASIPANMFRDLENVRFEGQEITCRGGQVKYNPDAVLEGCIDGFIPPDFEPRAVVEELLALGRDPFPADPSDDVTLRRVGSGSAILDSTTFDDACSFSYTTGSGSGGSGGLLWIGRGDQGNGFDITLSTFTLDNNDAVEAGSNATAVNAGSAAWGGAAKFDGDLFAVVSRVTSGGNGRSEVIIDPVGSGSAVDEDLVGNDTDHGYFPMWLKHQTADDTLCAPLGPSVVHMRNTSGVWSTAAMPASTTIKRNHVGSAAMYGSALYFTGTAAGGGNALFSLVGGAISQVHQPSGAPPTIAPVCAHNGVLWYVSSADGLSLGKYNGSTFTDGVITLEGSDAICALVSAAGKLYAYRTNSIWVSEFPERFWTQIDATTDGYRYGVVYPVV